MTKVTKENNLAVMRPDLAKEWHPTLNGDLTPYDVTCGSGKKVWWLLPYDDPKTGKHFDFVWDAVIHTRVKGVGCPVLAGLMVWPGFNDLATTHPELAAEWHPTKNGDLTPQDVTAGSDKKVHWIQPYDDPKTGKHFDFEWEATIAHRVQGNGCPVFNGKMVWPGFNDLATTHPELAAEWHPTKNDGLKPDMVMAGSNQKVWWYLPYDDPKTGKHFDFEWEAPIWSRVRGDGCPVLAGKMVWPGFNDLATTHPDLAKEWNFAKNGGLTPQNVTAGSHKKVYWMKEYDGELKEWCAMIYNRAVLGSECPDISSSKLESNVSNILKSNDTTFQNESCFDNLVSPRGYHYRYDFELDGNKVLIECDGRQHFENSNYYYKNDEEFSYRIDSDNIKNAYALKHGMALLRIPHIYSIPKKQKELEEIVLEFIKTKKVPQKILDFYAQFEFSNYVECVNKFQNQLEKTAA